MMDESPLGTKLLGAVKDEETDDTTFKHEWQKLIDEKQSIEHWKKEVRKLDPHFFVKAKDNKPFLFMTHKNIEIPSSAEERCARFTLPSPVYFKPFIRQKVKEEIGFNRECKKLEKVWTNRGLPVDKETVTAAASKDAFDLKDLSESLPSTSTSVNKPHNVEMTTWCQLKPSWAIEIEQIRRRRANLEMMQNHVPRNLTHDCKAPITGLSDLSATIPPACNSLMEAEQKERLRLVLAQRWARMKRYIQSYKKDVHSLLHLEKPDCDEQNEESEDSIDSRFKKALLNLSHNLYQNLPSSTSKQPNFGEEFAKMSIDDKQNEKKKETRDSDDENYQLNPVLNPLALITPYVPKLEMASSWDSNKHWNTKFDWVPKKLHQLGQEFGPLAQKLPDIPAPVPLNSPIKKEENTDKRALLQSLELTELRLNALKFARERTKLKTLNSFRKMFNGDEDSSVEVTRAFYQEVPRMDSSTQAEKLSKDKLKEYVKERTQMIREMKESLKTVRTISDPLVRHRHRRYIVKSDKVVPD